MAELTKQALKVQNNTEFPNNNAGLITPTKLRGFNVDMIDSLVDEISYQVDSASWNQQIDSLENFTASIATNFVTTGSFNSYTQSTDNRLTNIETVTASLNTSVTNINTFSASALTSISNLNTATQSLFVSASLALVTASFSGNTLTFTKGDTSTFGVVIPDVSGSTINTGSFVTTSSFNAYTASVTESVVTAIVTNNGSNYYIIDGVNQPKLSFVPGPIYRFDLSGIAGNHPFKFSTSPNGPTQYTTGVTSGSNFIQIEVGYDTTTPLYYYCTNHSGMGNEINVLAVDELVTTASFNSYTASQSTGSLVTSITSLNTFSASALVSISNLNASSASQQVSIDALNTNSASVNTSITNINSATQSLNTSASLALVTASFDNGTRNLTFTKGDTTTFNVNIPDVSGSAGDFVTTASFNSYTSSNDQKVNSLIAATGSYATTGSNTFTGNQTISGSSGGGDYIINAAGTSGTVTYGQTGGGNFQISQSGSVIMRATNSTAFEIYATASFIAAPSIPNITSDLKVNGNFTASLANGFTYVGNASGVTTLVATSSFGGGSTNTGSLLTTASVNVNVITFTKGDASTFDITVAASGSAPEGTISSSAQITALGFVSSSVTASSLVTASVSLNTITFTKGDASTFNITVNTGSGGGTTYINPTLNPFSGSLILAANTTSTASLATYITASDNGQVNLMFLNRNLSGGVYISGSSNIFPNPNAPSAGRLNYLGGSSNILLTSFTANNTQQFPTLTGSAATIGGVYPAMNGNILMGQGAWTINPSNNPGQHNYNNNILNGSTTFNMLGNVATTGNASAGLVGFTGNTSAGTFLINSPSRSIAEINAGATGSFRLSITNNNVQGAFQYNGPVSGSSANIHSITQNIVAGTVTMNVQSGSKGYTVSGNSINGTLVINDNTAFTPTLGSSVSYSNNIINGSSTFNTRNSGSFSVSNNNINTWTISSDADVSTITSANRLTTLNGNILGGVFGNNILYSGSTSTANARKQITSNIMAGNLISASVGGDEQALLATAVLGHGLTVFGTGICNLDNVSVGGERNGSAFFGRWNDNTLPKAGTAETIFAVGTGNSGSAGITRKTGFLIDSGSNTFVEGTLNVSGASTLNGNTIITGSLTLSSSAAIELNVVGNSTFTGSVAGNVLSASITSNTASIDFSLANYFEVTSSVTPLHLNVTNITPGRTSTLIISASASSSILFSSNVAQPSGSAYSGSAGSIDILSLVAFNTSKVNLVSTKALV